MDEELIIDNLLDSISDKDIEGLKKNIGKIDINKEIKESDDDYNIGTLLHYALHDSFVNEEILDIFIDAGADINKQNTSQGDTPLHVAVETEDYSALKYLLELGANYNIENNLRKTPKEVALRDRYPEAVNLIEFHDKYFYKRRNESDFDTIIMNNLYTSLWVGSDIKLIQHLNDWKEDSINKDITYFGPVLHTVLALNVTNFSDRIDFLIANGADINQLSEGEGKTPLQLAIEWNNYGKIECLLDKGANPFIEDKHGTNAIKYLNSSDTYVIIRDKINEKILNMAKDRYMEQLG